MIEVALTVTTAFALVSAVSVFVVFVDTVALMMRTQMAHHDGLNLVSTILWLQLDR